MTSIREIVYQQVGDMLWDTTKCHMRSEIWLGLNAHWEISGKIIYERVHPISESVFRETDKDVRKRVYDRVFSEPFIDLSRNGLVFHATDKQHEVWMAAGHPVYSILCEIGSVISHLTLWEATMNGKKHSRTS